MKDTEFRQILVEKGFDPPNVHKWVANLGGNEADLPLHTHDECIMLLITEGQLVLEYEDGPVTYSTGDICELPAGTAHVERTGPAGAKALLARKATS